MLLKKYKLIINLPNHSLKKGAIFEWENEEGCYITKTLSWFLSPLVDKKQIKDKKIFKKIE